MHACIGKMSPIPVDRLVSSLDKITFETIEDLEKRIDEGYNQLLEPILKDASRIFGTQ